MENNNEAWHQTAVSWGQLLISIVAVVGSLTGFILYNERRITVVEERQAFVLKAIAQDQSDMNDIRSLISLKLDAIQNQLTTITVELAKHKAIGDVLDEMTIGGTGRLRIPRKQ